jgi:hypothetical protein
VTKVLRQVVTIVWMRFLADEGGEFNDPFFSQGEGITSLLAID